MVPGPASRCCEQRPPQHDAGQHATGPESVAEPPTGHLKEKVGEAKRRERPSDFDLTQAQVGGHSWCRLRERYAVNVGDNRQQNSKSDDSVSKLGSVEPCQLDWMGVQLDQASLMSSLLDSRTVQATSLARPGPESGWFRQRDRSDPSCQSFALRPCQKHLAQELRSRPAGGRPPTVNS